MTKAAKIKTNKGSWVRKDFVIDLTGKTVIITGCNTGIGIETVIDLAKRGAKVVMACRNLEKAGAARERALEESQCKPDNLVVQQLDLSSFASIRKFANEFIQSGERLDILINNAGVMNCPFGKTEDGFETQFGTNHLGPFLLTNLLLDTIKKYTPSRIVNLSSDAHRGGNPLPWDDLNNENFKYSAWTAYCRSKLMNILFTKELDKKIRGTGVTTYAVHPGVVRTDLWRHTFKEGSCLTCCCAGARKAFKSPEHGAQTTIFCALAPELADISGKYYADCKEKQPTSSARKEVSATRLWEISAKATGLGN